VTWVKYEDVMMKDRANFFGLRLAQALGGQLTCLPAGRATRPNVPTFGTGGP